MNPIIYVEFDNGEIVFLLDKCSEEYKYSYSHTFAVLHKDTEKEYSICRKQSLDLLQFSLKSPILEYNICISKIAKYRILKHFSDKDVRLIELEDKDWLEMWSII